MTHESLYSVKAHGITEIKNLTLYEARKELIRVYNDGSADRDSLHIAREGRMVGFFCAWENFVKPMSQAKCSEIYCLSSWA